MLVNRWLTVAQLICAARVILYIIGYCMSKNILKSTDINIIRYKLIFFCKKTQGTIAYVVAMCLFNRYNILLLLLLSIKVAPDPLCLYAEIDIDQTYR